MSEKYIKKILKTQVYDVAIETPLDLMPNLSARVTNEVYVKREDLQPVFSFKLRGAYNKITQMPEIERQNGVIAASAGNFAQGVALSAKRLAIKALIVMPKTTPEIKVSSVKAYGADVILYGDGYDEAYQHALELADQKKMTFIHPYDDPDVIAGQGTVAMEILRQMHGGEISAIFVPVGGGGLIAGISAYVKHLYPEIKIIGVEPDNAACLYEALKAGKRVELEQVGIFADGVAVRQVGIEPFKVAKECVDEVILVSTDEICAAIKDIFEDTRSIAEPAGALAVAGMKKYIEREAVENESFVVIDSGANMNFDRLRHVSERAELGEKNEAILAVTIPEQPGSFQSFCRLLGQSSITEFNYRYSDATSALVFVGVQLRHLSGKKEELIEKLIAQGYAVSDLSDNELAKLHVRYMVGGRAQKIKNERVYRFEFPERPGALLKFLTKVGKRWNISLFHYRNHGAAYGRVLLGIQVDDSELVACQVLMDELGYRYIDETENKAYQMFLS
ncbi:MAG: threonine ammonia-lyase, biosynthetic [Gammaproteobacteria bacterium]|nr:threonine ammonia-lyase, biosynthetic [Gammaproteobacteria bacterium]